VVRVHCVDKREISSLLFVACWVHKGRWSGGAKTTMLLPSYISLTQKHKEDPNPPPSINKE